MSRAVVLDVRSGKSGEPLTMPGVRCRLIIIRG